MTAASQHWSARLSDQASDEILSWFRSQPDLETAWKTCRRGDCLLWLVDKLGIRTVELRRLAIALARTSLHLVDDPRSGAALDTMERFLRGDEMASRVHKTGWSACDAAADMGLVDNHTGLLAARAVSHIVGTDDEHSWAALDAARYARDALVAAGADRAIVEVLQADMVREHIPFATVVEAFDRLTRTPGPWMSLDDEARVGDLGRIVGANGAVVCDFGAYVAEDEQTSGAQPSAADLALILAAPEAVRLLAKLLPHVGDTAPMEDIEKAYDLVRVALGGAR